MSKLALDEITMLDSRGNSYVTRKPHDIVEALQRRVSGQEAQGHLDEIASSLPKIQGNYNDVFARESNLSRLAIGAGFEKTGPFEWVERHNPLFDRRQLKWLFGTVPTAYGAAFMANHGLDASTPEALRDVYDVTKVPEGISNVINTFQQLVPFLRGGEYDNAIFGLITTVAVAAALVKGIIPWRGDQLGWINQYKKGLKERIENGIQPYPGVGHVVVDGFRDPIIASEMEDGKSFLRHLRNEFGEVVAVQRSGPYYDPANLGLGFNDNGYYVNLEKLLTEGVARGEFIDGTLVSGLYKAGAYIGNMQRGYELFRSESVEGRERGDVDISMAARSLMYANALRELDFRVAPQLRSSFIIPQYFHINEGLDRGEDSWRSIAQSLFLKQGGTSVDGIIVPELVFLDMAYKALQERNALGMSIFINTYGEDQAQEKAQRAVEGLKRVHQNYGGEVPLNFVNNPEKARGGASIVLRANNTHLDIITTANRDIHGHELVLYATTLREDTGIVHAGGGRRVPIHYKAEIARLAFEHIMGIPNDYSMTNLAPQGRLTPV
jgi:hypothetical protein